MRSLFIVVSVTLIGMLPAVSLAGSRILATGGASPIEGGGGGGLSPWSVITGYASSSEWGASVFGTRVVVDDFVLDAAGFGVGWHDRLELTYTRQSLEVDPLDLTLDQDIYGAKLKVFGELLYTTVPQISVGVQHKRQRDFDVPALLGAKDAHGTDVYVSASKLFFAALAGRNLLLNGTVRHTRANETGLLGFGGPDDDGSVVFEGSAVVFINNHWVVGYEYRQKPDHLAAVQENHWQDVFVGLFINKHLSLVAAHVDLDEIAGLPDQSGTYLSLQAAF